MAKFVFTCGLIHSGCGKGSSMGSLGMLMKMRGHTVQAIKLDGMLNSSGNSLNPIEHGNAYQNDEICGDLDLGTYEEFMGISTGRKNIYTAGALYKELIQEQEDGKWLGETVQVVPHLVSKVQEKIELLAKEAEIVFIEIGGIVGDIENNAYIECMRRFKQIYKNDTVVIVIAPIITMSIDGALKTKPIQNGLKQLNGYGLNADILICRTINDSVPPEIIKKITDNTGLYKGAIFLAPDVKTIYEVPLKFHEQHLDNYVADLLNLPRRSCKIQKYSDTITKIKNITKTIDIGLVGKYTDGQDAYLSVLNAIFHAGSFHNVKVNVRMISAEHIENNPDEDHFKDLNGIVIPGGFGNRGIDGMITAVKHCRENNKPFLGICLGLQISVIEYARNVLGLKNANSQEFDVTTKSPVIHYIKGQETLVGKSETMRLGAYDCELIDGSMANKLYKKKTVSERHRHRLEVNPDYIENKEFKVSGVNPQTNLIEIMELTTHPYFIASQFHSEFRSSLMSPHPLFLGLVKASLENNDKTI